MSVLTNETYLVGVWPFREHKDNFKMNSEIQLFFLFLFLVIVKAYASNLIGQIFISNLQKSSN
jgi:hypothetical protein